jgi:DNA-binding transcriptional MerR regulator
VRTLHFYDEVGLLKPAYHGANGYRFYEEPQLLTLQQILFYRELGFELKQIQQILGRADFAVVGALQAHRRVLDQNIARTRRLLETIDKTIQHLKGTKKMKSKDMFAGFSVAAGKDRFNKQVKLAGEPVHCKLSAKDTGGAMCVFEITVGWPYHLHHEQDEWIYVIDGELLLQVGNKRFRARAGESVFIPRKVAHGLAPLADRPGKFINAYQPAGNMEEFFRQIGNFKKLPTREDVINETYTEDQIKGLAQVFEAHGMDLLPPKKSWLNCVTQGLV